MKGPPANHLLKPVQLPPDDRRAPCSRVRGLSHLPILGTAGSATHATPDVWSRMPDDALVRLSWAMTEAVDAELRLRTVVVRLRTTMAELQAGQPPSIALSELTQHFTGVRDQLTTIIGVLPQP